MSEIMSHAQWMSLTNGGAMSVRSTLLKAVDTALQQYHLSKSDADKQALSGALLKWMQSKGNAWRSSVRNRHRAVEALYAELAGLSPAMSGIERVGLSALRDESRAIVVDLFAGKRLEWRPGVRGQLGQQKWGTSFNTLGLAGNATQVAGAIQGAVGGTGLARDLFDSVVPPEVAAEVGAELASILPDFMGELAASLTPFVGVIFSGGAAAWNAKNALRGQWRLESARQHISGSLASAEPAAALEALTRFLERERNQDVYAMSVSLAEFGSKLAATLADGGTASNAAIGLTANLLKLMNILRIVVRDVQEKNAANRAMLTRVDAGIFDICPVVGAYLICCAPTSVMVNTIFDSRFGEPGWQDQVEIAVKRHLGPLQEQARRVVHAHRFWIPALANHQGMLEVNQQKLAAMLARKDKSGMVGISNESYIPVQHIRV